jgi:hypothetical protein
MHAQAGLKHLLSTALASDLDSGCRCESEKGLRLQSTAIDRMRADCSIAPAREQNSTTKRKHNYAEAVYVVLVPHLRESRH